jgi:hypothetical protein
MYSLFHSLEVYAGPSILIAVVILLSFLQKSSVIEFSSQSTHLSFTVRDVPTVIHILQCYLLNEIHRSVPVFLISSLLL